METYVITWKKILGTTLENLRMPKLREKKSLVVLSQLNNNQFELINFQNATKY